MIKIYRIIFCCFPDRKKFKVDKKVGLLNICYVFFYNLLVMYGEIYEKRFLYISSRRN